MEATTSVQRIPTMTLALANEGKIPAASMTLDSPIPPPIAIITHLCRECVCKWRVSRVNL